MNHRVIRSNSVQQIKPEYDSIEYEQEIRKILTEALKLALISEAN